MKKKIRVSTLPNGIRVVTEERDSDKAAFVFMVGCGSRYDPNKKAGLSHALEHMMFMGTPQRSSFEISKETEKNGADTNAYTDPEKTYYLFNSLTSRFENVVSIYGDLLNNSILSEKEWGGERRVIKEERDMGTSDTDSAHCLLLEKMFDLRMGILGSKQTIGNIRTLDMRELIRKYYLPKNIVISVAGGISHGRAMEVSERFFGNFHKSWGVNKNLPELSPITRSGKKYAEKIISLNQTNIAIGFPAYSRFDSRRYALLVMCNILGEGFSSRLFCQIREKMGLTYSIYSDFQGFKDMGYFYISTCSTKPQKTVIRIMEELDKIRNFGATKEEVERVKFQLKSALLMREDSDDFAEHNAKSLLFHKHVISEKEHRAGIYAVTEADVLEVARDIFDMSKATVAVTGPKSLRKEIEKMY